MNGIPLRYRLLSVCAATLLSGCGGASIDLLPPPDSAPVEGETAAESRLPAAPAVPRASDIAWQEASGPIFDWRAEIAPAAVGDHGRQGLTPPAAAETGSGTSAAAAAGAMALEPAGQGPLPGVGSPPPAVAAELPWQGVAGPIFDWGTRSPATAGETASAGELQPWQRREQRLHRLPGWRLSGRVAITAPEESWSAVVRWM